MSPISFVRERFSPFRHAGFRAFFAAQSLSLVGSWMQELAKSWIVLNMLGKSSAMGALLFVAAVPNLLLGAYGGSLADQRNIKAILLITQVALATLAFSLGILVHGSDVKFWHLLVFAVLEGVIISFDMPAFQKITPQLVPRHDFQQAIALNAVNFHLSRVIGPSIAGVIMSMGSVSSVFWINAVSFLGVVVVVSRLPGHLKTPTVLSAQSEHGMGVAWSYIRSNPFLWRILLQFMLLMALVFPLVFTTLRVMFQHRFHLNSEQYGLVFAGPGLGALLGSVTFLLWSPKKPHLALPFGIFGLVLFGIILAECMTLSWAVVILVLFSFFMFLTISSVNVTLQLRIEERMRGRVSALTGMAFISVAPIMSAPLGLLSDWMGERALLWGVSLVFGLSSLVLGGWDRMQARKFPQDQDSQNTF